MKWVSFTVGIFLFVLLCTELMLRVHFGIFSLEPLNTKREFLKVPHLQRITHPIIFDPELGWTPEPGAQKKIWGKMVNILPSGLRSNSLKTTKRSKFVILAMGDSYTFGDLVGDNETWPAYLESISNAKVLNGGVSSYGLDQTYLRTKKLIPKLKPDILIVSFISDDIARTELSIRYAEKPFYKYRDGKITLARRLLSPWNAASITRKAWYKRQLSRSMLLHLFMVKINPFYWYSLDIVREHKDGIKVSCLLTKKFAELKAKYQIPIVLLSQYGEGKSKQILKCAKENGLNTLNVWPTIKKTKNQFQIKDHMSPAENRQVAVLIKNYLIKGASLLPSWNGTGYVPSTYPAGK